ncbi:MAG: sigma-70 family RNA polymerase sigma factor [Deltaproteobacteria bacterium]|nr:sigma-70 family RNA polymerase sigma factor [Deltaproteobacteria bacterium]
MEFSLSLRYNGAVAGERKDKIVGRETFAREAVMHLDHLYRVAFHLAKQEDEAQDLVQETYARALGSYEQFTPGTNMKAWLTRILYNFFFDHYHQKKRWVSAEDKAKDAEGDLDYWAKVADDDPGPESAVLDKELSLKITDALRKIPEEFRLPIILVDMGDFAYAEAAEVLSCPVGTVRSRLSRGRRLLHGHLRGYVGPKETE